MRRLVTVVLLVAACTAPEGDGSTAAPTSRPVVTEAPAAAPLAPPAEVYYENCDAVRAAGQAPLSRGDPGYRAGLDRDDDGSACE